jgi:hypothetical protein
MTTITTNTPATATTGCHSVRIALPEVLYYCTSLSFLFEISSSDFPNKILDAFISFCKGHSELQDL